MKKTFEFDFKKGDFNMINGRVVTLSGKAALQMWISKCLRTQYERYKMYSGKEYGANIEDLVIGNTYGIDFLSAELRREIETALLRHEDIYSMIDFSVKREAGGLNISFTLETCYGTYYGGTTYDD
jgi:hypothetical protein